MLVWSVKACSDGRRVRARAHRCVVTCVHVYDHVCLVLYQVGGTSTPMKLSAGGV